MTTLNTNTINDLNDAILNTIDTFLDRGCYLTPAAYTNVCDFCAVLTDCAANNTNPIDCVATYAADLNETVSLAVVCYERASQLAHLHMLAEVASFLADVASVAGR